MRSLETACTVVYVKKMKELLYSNVLKDCGWCPQWVSEKSGIRNILLSQTMRSAGSYHLGTSSRPSYLHAGGRTAALQTRQTKGLRAQQLTFFDCFIPGPWDPLLGARVLAEDYMKRLHLGANAACCCTGHFMSTSRTAFLHDMAEQACGCRVSSRVQPPWGTPFKQHKLT